MKITPNRFPILILVLCFIITGLHAQSNKVITLPELQAKAKDYYPLLKQKDLHQQMGEVRAHESAAHLKPQVMAVGQGTYQSEVTKFDFPAGGEFHTPIIKPDQYSLGLQVEQNLFDYGVAKTEKEIAISNSAAQAQQAEVQYVQVKERVNQLFGMIVMQQENRKIMELRKNEIDAQRMKMQSAVDNGAALRSNYLVLESEYLQSEQRIEEIKANQQSNYKTLNTLTGLTLDSTYTFVLPDNKPLETLENIRPEYEMFRLQDYSLATQSDLIHKENLPKFSAFGQGYVGRPGYNFLNNDFRAYGMLGLGMKWNLSSYYTDDDRRSDLSLQQMLVDNNKQIFDINLKAAFG
jgi:outer membrane protein TolC